MTADRSSITVSVVIPAFNAKDYIGRAIDSVLAQTRRADEIIIVDDGSTDDTRQILQPYGDAVRYLYRDNAGAARARNTAIEAARSEWIAFLDADDVYDPQKLKRQIELLEKNPDLVWCYGNYQTCLFGTEQIRRAHDPVQAEAYLSGNEYFENYLNAYEAGFPGHTNTLLVKRIVLDEIGGFDKTLSWGQDADLCFRIAYRYPKVGYAPQSLAVTYFKRPGSITDLHWGRADVRCDFLRRHLALSRQAGQREAFEACAAILLRRWIRQMQQESLHKAIRPMVHQFRPLIPGDLRREAWLRYRLPKGMHPLLDGYLILKNRIAKGRKKIGTLFCRYRPEPYWEKRHRRYGMDLRGVGNSSLSAEQNEAMYVQACRIVLEVCGRQGVDWKSAHVLDIGCGSGFYTALFQECGVVAYTGVDITKVLFPNLQKRFPHDQFVQLDVTQDELQDVYDLIVMIDVTQHIVQPRRFRRAMKNVWAHLKPGGLFLVTSWLSPRTIRRQPHETARPLADYQKAFPDAEFRESVPFRDKYLLAIRKPLDGKPIA